MPAIETRLGRASNVLHGDAAARAAQRLSEAQIATMFSTAPTSLVIGYLASLLVAVVLVVAYDLPVWRAVVWGALHTVLFAPREIIAYSYWRRPDGTPYSWRWAYWFTALLFLCGSAWGFGIVFLLQPASPEEEMLLVLVLLGLGSGSAIAFAAYWPALCAHLLPLCLTMAYLGLHRADAFHEAFAALGAGYLIAILGLAWRANNTLTQSLRHDLEKRELIGGLSAQKDLAEKADKAKSRFLAAASHDLRQPIHALSMFVGALRERSLDTTSARLVEQISGSVDAMDGLFSSLLDISRLDAGVVHPNLEGIPVQPLIERVCDHFRMEANRKGVSLKITTCSAYVRTDPVLLENIIRNVVGNAVRYTDQGRILIGCRRGKRLRVDVLDTGRGIAAEYTERVFEEFFQIGNFERDRSQGLGLGLAIVKRVAVLIGAEIHIASELRHGTRFSLFVPLSSRPQFPVGRKSSIERRLDSSLIFVIDDELAIRQGMETLLSSWGHQVAVASSGAEIMTLVGASSLCPDLIICDLRLREGENGIDLIEKLRNEYNKDIPAIIITGDTGPERLTEVQRSRYPILYKPVSSANLRAAIQSTAAAKRALKAAQKASALQ